MVSLPLLLSGLTFVGSALPPQAPATAPTAIVGARLEIGDGSVVENGTLVMSGGRIVAIGSGVSVPSGATVIDGKGLVVFPGFIDAYSNTGLTLPDAPANVGAQPDTTNTAPATMWAGNRKGLRADIRAATALNPKSSFADRAAQGITTVLFSSGTGSIAGTAALVDLTPAPTVVMPEVAHEFVLRGGGRFGGAHDDLAGAQGAPPSGQGNPPGPPPNTAPPGGVPQTQNRPGGGTQTPAAPTGYPYPGTLYGITALVRQTLYDARAYASAPKPEKPDATYEGLRSLVSGRVPALFTLNTSREIARVARLADEFGFRMVVNGVPDAYRMVDLLKRRNVPVIVSLEVPDEPRRTLGTGADPVPVRVLEDRYAQYKERMGNARVLDEAGVTIAFRKGPDDYLAGVRKFVAASGLSRAGALKAMTSGAARALNAERTHGSLQVGKMANLVILTGDFLDEKATVRTTIVEGVVIEPAKKEAN